MPKDSQFISVTLELINEICQKVKCYRMGVTLNAQSAQQFIERIGAITSIEQEIIRTGWIAYRRDQSRKGMWFFSSDLEAANWFFIVS